MPTGDLNNDGIVDAIDLSIFVSRWGSNDPDADLNNDGIVDAADLSILVSNWGETSGGSAEGTVLLVTNETELSAGNQALYDRLIALGYTVITRLDSDPVDYDGIDIIVTGSITGSNINGKYANPLVPIVCVDSWPHFGLGSSIGFENNIDTLEVTNDSHPLSGGLSNGTHVVYNTPGYLVWSTNYNQATAIIIATNPGESNQPIVFGYEAGSMMATEYATTRHVGLGLHKDVRFDMTSAGWALFDAAITWAKDSAYVAPPPPSAPTNLTATAGDMQVSLSWSSVSGADSYTIKRSTTDGGPYSTIQSSHTSTSFTDTNLSNGTTYYYVISATNTQGESPDSTQVSATPVEGSGGSGDVERLGLFVTQQELDEWRNRAVNGPFKSMGDYSPGSPGDWDEMMNQSQQSLSEGRWTGPTHTNYPYTRDNTGSNDFPSSARRHGARLKDAGYVALINNDMTLAQAVRSELLTLANQSRLDFTDSTKWRSDQPDFYDTGMMFGVVQWGSQILEAWDAIRVLGVNDDPWFGQWLLALGYISKINIHLTNVFPNRYQNDYSVRSSFVDDYDQDGAAFTLANGTVIEGPRIARFYNNRRMHMAAFCGLIGVFMNDETMKEELRVFNREVVMFGYRRTPEPIWGDYNRWTASLPQLGMYYGFAAEELVNAADALARIGDNSAYEILTSEGSGGSWGTQDDNKTFLEYLEYLLSYIDGSIEHYGTDQSGNAGNDFYRIKSIGSDGGGQSWREIKTARGARYFQNQWWHDVIARKAPGTTSWDAAGHRGQGTYNTSLQIYGRAAFLALEMQDINPYPNQ